MKGTSMKLNIRENYSNIDFSIYDIVVENLNVTELDLNDFLCLNENIDIFTDKDFSIDEMNWKDISTFVKTMEQKFGNNQNSLLDKIVCPLVEKSDYKRYNPVLIIPPYSSVTSNKNERNKLGYARYYNYKNDVQGNVSQIIINTFNNFIIRIGNHLNKQEKKSYDNSNTKVNFIEITKNQIQKITEGVNYIIDVRTNLLEYLNKANIIVETIDNIPNELIENLLKAKRQHITIK